MKIILHSDEVNLLIYRYLQEAGFFHTAFTFCAEANLGRPVTIPNSSTSFPPLTGPSSVLQHFGPRLPPNCLVSMLHKALLYCWVEHHTDPDTGMEIPCDQPFGFFNRHYCRVEQKPLDLDVEDDARKDDAHSQEEGPTKHPPSGSSELPGSFVSGSQEPSRSSTTSVLSCNDINGELPASSSLLCSTSKQTLLASKPSDLGIVSQSKKMSVRVEAEDSEPENRRNTSPVELQVSANATKPLAFSRATMPSQIVEADSLCSPVLLPRSQTESRSSPIEKHSGDRACVHDPTSNSSSYLEQSERIKGRLSEKRFRFNGVSKTSLDIADINNAIEHCQASLVATSPCSPSTHAFDVSDSPNTTEASKKTKLVFTSTFPHPRDNDEICSVSRTPFILTDDTIEPVEKGFLKKTQLVEQQEGSLETPISPSISSSTSTRDSLVGLCAGVANNTINASLVTSSAIL